MPILVSIGFLQYEDEISQFKEDKLFTGLSPNKAQGSDVIFISDITLI